ncbi:MAG: right-handed parallel beta-helix repeat-containing protein, partial [Bacteroidales bacterium]|nr:right-handed parallel beta-helix repeat-containing protein [Bacteroidales bacterium]
MKTTKLVLSIGFILGSSLVFADVINVPDDQSSIQAGINAAANGDTVLVQPGTYVENIDFNGKLITVASLFLTTQDTTYISSTIIDGNNSGKVVIFENSEDSTAILCGFTITNGLASGIFPAYCGGGIYCSNSSPGIENITITGNSANEGGGIYCYNSSPSLVNVTISGNDGSGISCNHYSSPSLENVTISGNTAAGSGGGIYCYQSSPGLQNVTITGNSAIWGGGICCWDNSSPSLQYVTISGNSANNDGGGICCGNSSLSLENVIISCNTADNKGGGIYCGNSSLSLENVIISCNSDCEWGGGIYCEHSSPSLENVTILGNSAIRGGGICCWDNSSPSLRNVTIASNTASNEGGGIWCYNSSPSLINSILWNDSPEEIYIYISGSVAATYSDIQGGWTGTGNIDSDPLFVDPGNGDYHLQYNSPCIDAGDPASPLDPDGTIADMGAYYLHHLRPVWHISTTGSDITGNGSEQYPFATIQLGINLSADTDTVLVQPGTYAENIDFNGKLITVGSLFLTTRDPIYISSTIIDGNSNGRVIIFFNGENSTAILRGFTIINGLAGYGGGIFCGYNSSPSLQHLTISGNSTSGTYGYGGGICCWENSSPSLENVTILGNSAIRGGGICCWDNSSPSLRNVTIASNTASNEGGGIYCWDYSSPSLQNVTISGNFSTNLGGGIYCAHSNLSLINSILWNNSPQEIHIISCSVTATYSDIQGSWAGTGNIDIDPLFVDPGNGDYHLQSNSPCIDTGNPDTQYNDPDFTRSDMGAYYFNQYNGPVWYISTTGSDQTGIGTEQYPFATIQHGINCSSDTDTVFVQPGTYVENIEFNGKLITVGSLFLTTRDTTYISSTYIDGNSNGNSVVNFYNGEDSTAVLSGFTITNGSSDYGGGICCFSSSPSLQNVTITDNSASKGGGICCYLSSPSLENVAISGNSALHNGGGIYCSGANPSLENVTITGNYAADNGGGIYCVDSYPVVINSILWNDSPQEIYIVSGSVVTATYSDIEGGWTGIGNISADPLFVDPGIGNYHLQSISPCIDAGNPASPLDPDGTIADMGAYFFNQYNGPVWHISTTGSDLTGIGSEQYPFATIQHGINTSSNTDTVLVQPGTYVENINYNGKLITVGSLFLTTQDTTNISLTIIDGNSSGRVVTFNNSEDSTTVLCGFTITNGLASGEDPANNGGGIYCNSNSSPKFERLTISGNTASSCGGGIYCYQSNPSLENVTITGNSAYHGGGIYCRYYSILSLQNVTITGNSASGTYGIGGGIYCCYDSSPSLQNVTISDNSASADGGGISCYGNANPILQNVTITGNFTQNGGGIYCHSSSPILQNVTISGNSAFGNYGVGGGIYCVTDSNPIIQYVIILNNSADYGGGIYFNDNSSPSLENVTITGNSATANGGGIYCNHYSSPILQNITISDNSASDDGGGIYCYFNSNPSLINSILWSDSPQEIFISPPASVTATYSDIEGGWTGTGNIDSDPLFVDPGNGDYHLQYTSPCIDAGDPASPLDPDGTIADMGAYFFNQYNGPVWHISTTGSDITGSGTEQYPFATIQHGINCSADTDTVLVQPGTYVENINFNGKLITVGSLFLTTQDTTYVSSTIIDG